MLSLKLTNKQVNKRIIVLFLNSQETFDFKREGPQCRGHLLATYPRTLTINVKTRSVDTDTTTCRKSPPSYLHLVLSRGMQMFTEKIYLRLKHRVLLACRLHLLGCPMFMRLRRNSFERTRFSYNASAKELVQRTRVDYNAYTRKLAGRNSFQLQPEHTDVWKCDCKTLLRVCFVKAGGWLIR